MVNKQAITIKLTRCLIFLAIGFYNAAAYRGPDLLPGVYCGLQAQCCPNRNDLCSHKILDTICYCDEFCNRTTTSDDCCPDYVPVCHVESQPNTHVRGCNLNGKLYFRGDTAFMDCNECTCIFDDKQQATRWKCDEDPCIISQAVIDGVRHDMSWRPKNYTQFAGKKLKDGLIYKLGTLPLSPATKRMNPIRYDKHIDYPTDFDARQRWPGYISPIIDQGWCGSDWAITVASVASDRFAIQSNGVENMRLSPQTLLSCNVRHQQGCAGGHVDIAWNFARTFGLVDETCFPYKAIRTICPFTLMSTLQEDGCHPSVQQRTLRYNVGPVGRIKLTEDIMQDIMELGPMFAVMTVYQDFFHYGSGIYRRSNYGNTEEQGLHSVRIVGWGQELGDKYWVVANSWGTEWGENGYFRIARGSNECDIESFVISATSKVVEVYQRN